MSSLRRDDQRIVLLVLRALRGWDQKQLAAAAGVAQSTISRYEQGSAAPSQANLERITQAVGLPPAWIEQTLVPFLRTIREASGTSGRVFPAADDAHLLGDTVATAMAEAIQKATMELARGMVKTCVWGSEIRRQFS